MMALFRKRFCLYLSYAVYCSDEAHYGYSPFLIQHQFKELLSGINTVLVVLRAISDMSDPTVIPNLLFD